MSVRAVRPGGILAFHEIDIEAGCWSEPHFPLLHSCFQWIIGAFTAGGMVTDIGRKISVAFAQEGLESRLITRDGLLESGADSEAYDFMAGTVRTLTPVIIKLGLATEQELSLGTLSGRLRTQSLELGAHFIPCFLLGATARKPA